MSRAIVGAGRLLQRPRCAPALLGIARCCWAPLPPPPPQLWAVAGGATRRCYALDVGRKRRRGGRKGPDGDAKPSTQDARIVAPPVNARGTNFGAAAAASAPRPGAYETAEHASLTLNRVYGGIKDMESSNAGLVVRIDEEECVTVEIASFEPTAGPEIPGGTYSLAYNASKEQLVLFSPFDNRTHKYELNTAYARPPAPLRLHTSCRVQTCQCVAAS